MTDLPTRDELAERYLAQLPYAPYPVQEDALLAWFTAEQGVLVCAPTGTGKTLIAQAALFDALFRIRLGTDIGGAAIQIRFPTRLFPAIETGFLEELPC